MKVKNQEAKWTKLISVRFHSYITNINTTISNITFNYFRISLKFLRFNTALEQINIPDNYGY